MTSASIDDKSTDPRFAPGASGTPGVSSPLSASAVDPDSPGDEAPPGTPGTGENVCPTCGGTGKAGGGDGVCEECGGTGKVTTGIGGA